MLLQYITARYEAPLRVGYNKVTHGELTHTQRRSHTEKVISGEVVLTTLMPIVKTSLMPIVKIIK